MDTAIPKEKELSKNDYLIISMIEEAQGFKPGVTRTGVIKDVLSTVVNDKKNNIFVIQVNKLNNYVYMFEENAPLIYQSKTRIELIGKEINFKPCSYEDEKIIVSNKIIFDYYTTLKQNKRIIYGKVLKRLPYKNQLNKHVKYKHDKKEYILVVSKGDVIYIPYKDIPDKFRKKRDIVGLLTGIVITDVTQEGKITGSINKAYDLHKEQLIDHLNNDRPVTVKIGKFIPGGALCYYKNDVDCIMLNKNFSDDYTDIKDVYIPSNKIKVKKSEIGKFNEFIYIEPIIKYRSPNNIKLESIKINEKYKGEVVRVSAFGCFVRIAPGTDALCPISFRKRDPLVGDKVVIEIINAAKKEHHLRGKITEWEDELLDLTKYNFTLKEEI